MKVYFDDLIQEFVSISTNDKGYTVTLSLLLYVPYEQPYHIDKFEIDIQTVEELNNSEALIYKVINTEKFNKGNIVVMGTPNRLKENNQ